MYGACSRVLSSFSLTKEKKQLKGTIRLDWICTIG
jgi:hypothetical protein